MTSSPSTRIPRPHEHHPEADARRREQRLAGLAVAVTVLLWASSFSVIRVTGEQLSAGPMALARVGLAAVLLTPLALRHRGNQPLLPRGAALLRVLAYGLLWFAAYFVALNEAEQHIDAATAALLVNLTPLLIALGAAVMLREPFSRALFAGSVVGLLGVAVMGLGAGDPGGDVAGIGVVLGLLAATFYAGAVLIQKRLLATMDMFHVTWLGCAVGTVALLPFGPRLLEELSQASVGGIVGTVYLGVFPTAVGFSTWAYALRRLPAGRLGSVGYLVTVVSVLMSWVFLAEVPTPLVLAGGVLCVAGVAISRRPKSPEPGRARS